jgi:WD40 repeat protein
VAFSPDGHILAAGSYDGKVWLWNLTNPGRPAPLGQPLTGPTNSVSSVAFSLDGHLLAASSFDGTAQIWNLDVDAAIQRICATTSGALVPAQWKHYISQLPYDPPCARPGHYGLLVH